MKKTSIVKGLQRWRPWARRVQQRTDYFSDWIVAGEKTTSSFDCLCQKVAESRVNVN